MPRGPPEWRCSVGGPGIDGDALRTIDLAVSVGRGVEHAEDALGVPAAPPEPVHATVGTGEARVWLSAGPKCDMGVHGALPDRGPAFLQGSRGGHAEGVGPAQEREDAGDPHRVAHDLTREAGHPLALGAGALD